MCDECDLDLRGHDPPHATTARSLLTDFQAGSHTNSACARIERRWRGKTVLDSSPAQTMTTEAKLVWPPAQSHRLPLYSFPILGTILVENIVGESRRQLPVDVSSDSTVLNFTAFAVTPCLI